MRRQGLVGLALLIAIAACENEDSGAEDGDAQVEDGGGNPDSDGGGDDAAPEDDAASEDDGAALDAATDDGDGGSDAEADIDPDAEVDPDAARATDTGAPDGGSPDAYVPNLATPCGALPPGYTLPADVLVDVGHRSTGLLRLSETRLLSASDGSASRWVLWDRASRDRIAMGDVALRPSPDDIFPPARAFIDMRGDVLALEPTLGTFEFRSAADGSVLGSVSVATTKIGLASDGSYFWATTASALAAWSPDGTPLFSRAGNYLDARIAALPGVLRVGLGPAGASVIESVTTAGASSVSAMFNGTFHAWFLDGARFMTTTGNVVRVYAATGFTAPEALFPLPSVNGLTGLNTYVWTSHYSLAYPRGGFRLYAIADASQPVLESGELLGVSDATLGVLRDGSVDLVSLDGPTPVTSSVATPDVEPRFFAVASGGAWAFAGYEGAIFDSQSTAETRRWFGCGKVRSAALADNGRLALATSTRLLIADLTASGRPFTHDLPVVGGSKVDISADGAVVAASTGGLPVRNGPTALAVFGLPSGTLTKRWSYPTGSFGAIVDFQLARGGGQLTQTLYEASAGCSVHVSDPAGASSYAVGGKLCEDAARISPDGTYVTVAQQASQPEPISALIYYQGTLVEALPEQPVGWLDDGRVLTTAAIYNPIGVKLADNATLINALWYKVMSPDRIYHASGNAVYELPSYSMIWSGPRVDLTAGTAAAQRAAYALRERVYIESY